MRCPRTAPLGMSLALLAGMAGAGLCAQAPPARRANARTLVRLAADACAGAVHAVEQTGPPEPRLLPLHDALTRMQTSLGDVGSRLAAHDILYFQALSRGTRNLAELGVVWPRTGLQNAEIDGRLRTLSALYGRLRNRYGREWLRFRTGRPLDTAERTRFAQVQAAQSVFAGALLPLLERARRQGDPRTAGDLDLLVSQANRIAQAPPILDEALNASVLSDTMEGEYAATRAANPADDPEWNDADHVAEQIQTDASVGFVFTANLDSVQAWSFVEADTDLPDGPDAGGGLAAGTAGSSAPGAPGALDEALAVAPRIDLAPRTAVEDEDEGLDGEAEILDGAEQDGDEPAVESAVDGAGMVELSDEDEEGVAPETPGEAAPEKSATNASVPTESSECTAESAEKDCTETPPAATPSPKPPPAPPGVLPR